jgi:hypothetical protein
MEIMPDYSGITDLNVKIVVTIDGALWCRFKCNLYLLRMLIIRLGQVICGRWLSTSTSSVIQFISVWFSLFWMLALYSNFTSWCSQYLSSQIANCLTSFASITDCGRVFHKSMILLVKENFLTFILQNFFLIFLLWPLVRVLGSSSNIPSVTLLS